MQHHAKENFFKAVKSRVDRRRTLGPVVQNIVSVTSLLVVKMLTILESTRFNSQVFLLKKRELLLQMQKLLTFFSAKILGYMPYLMIKVLTIR